MSSKQTVEVTVSNRTIARLILVVFGTLLALTVLGKIANTLSLIFIAGFLALAINPAVSWLSHKLNLKSRVTATGIAYLFVLSIIIFFATIILPPLIRQTVSFVVNDAPQTVESLKDSDSPLGRLVQRYKLESQVDGFIDDINERTEDIREPVLTTAGRVGGILISIVTVLVLTFMMLVEGPKWIKKYWALQPKARREHQQKLASQMYGIVTGYVNGQLILALLGSMFTLVALIVSSSLLNVTVNAIALAGIVFITGLIPMIGYTIGGALVVLACLLVSWPLAVVMAIYLILYQQVENVTLQPYIQAKFNELTPLLVFIAALIGISLGGILMAVVAIPVAGCIKILFLDFLERRGLRNN